MSRTRSVSDADGRSSRSRLRHPRWHRLGPDPTLSSDPVLLRDYGTHLQNNRGEGRHEGMHALVGARSLGGWN
jgi:hypothetical protein